MSTTDRTTIEKFSAEIACIGINPFVYLPEQVLESIFTQANRRKGKIPVKLTIEGHPFRQTLIKYAGHWRLYLNTPMRTMAQKKVGDRALFEICFDAEERAVPMHAKLKRALDENPEAKQVYEKLRPSLQTEMLKYISFLKTEGSIDRNIQKAIAFLLGKGRFIGRDHP